MVKMFECKISY